MAKRSDQTNDAIQVGDWKVERRLTIARIEGSGPMNAEDECAGHCCLHGVYIALPERDRVMEYADRIKEVMDETQTGDTSEWFEDDIHADEDFPGGLCIGTAVHNHKCVFLNGDGLCVLQLLEPQLGLPENERLKPFYCRLFPLTTGLGHLEFDDLCDGVRPCCTLAADGRRRALEAWAYEFKEALGEEGYDELCRAAEAEEKKLESGRRIRA
jgi:Fe-S-cluster containining protein